MDRYKQVYEARIKRAFSISRGVSFTKNLKVFKLERLNAINMCNLLGAKRFSKARMPESPPLGNVHTNGV